MVGGSVVGSKVGGGPVGKVGAGVGASVVGASVVGASVVGASVVGASVGATVDVGACVGGAISAMGCSHFSLMHFVWSFPQPSTSRRFFPGVTMPGRYDRSVAFGTCVNGVAGTPMTASSGHPAALKA